MSLTTIASRAFARASRARASSACSPCSAAKATSVWSGRRRLARPAITSTGRLQASSRPARADFLILPASGSRRAEVGDRSRHQQDVASTEPLLAVLAKLLGGRDLAPDRPRGMFQRDVGGDHRHLGASAQARPAASARPMRPEELLPTNRTLSIGSRVPPAVTSTLSPRQRARRRARRRRSRRRWRARRQLAPASASDRLARAKQRGGLGQTTHAVLAGRRQAACARLHDRHAALARTWRLACTAACSYMWLFIAGRDDLRAGGGESRAAEQVVRGAAGELCDRVRRRRSDQEDIGVLDQRQVVERLVGWRRLPGERAARGIALELADQHRRAGQRGERLLADEPAAGWASAQRARRVRPRWPGARTPAPCRRRCRHSRRAVSAPSACFIPRPEGRQPLSGRLRGPVRRSEGYR